MEPLIDRSRAALGDDPAEAVWREGRGLTFDQALQRALEGAQPLETAAG